MRKSAAETSCVKLLHTFLSTHFLSFSPSFPPPHLPPSLWLSLSSTAQNTDSVLNPGVQHDPLKHTHTRTALRSGCVSISSIPRSKLNSISGAQSQKGYDTTDLINMRLPFEVATTTRPIMHYTTSVLIHFKWARSPPTKFGYFCAVVCKLAHQPARSDLYLVISQSDTQQVA